MGITVTISGVDLAGNTRTVTFEPTTAYHFKRTPVVRYAIPEDEEENAFEIATSGSTADLRFEYIDTLDQYFSGRVNDLLELVNSKVDTVQTLTISDGSNSKTFTGRITEVDLSLSTTSVGSNRVRVRIQFLVGGGYQ